MANRIPSTSTSWPAAWPPGDDFFKGEGVVGIGKVCSLRFHSVASKTDIARYTAFVIDVKNVHVRAKHAKYGTEIEPNWRLDANGPNKLSYDQLAEKLSGGSSSNAASTQLLDKTLLQELHPHKKGRFEFWMEPDAAKRSGLKVGDEAVFKTNGNNIILAELRSTGFTGEGGEVMNQISKISDSHLDGPQVLAQDLMEGVADDEWDD